jgi:hypothetical protein
VPAHGWQNAAGFDAQATSDSENNGATEHSAIDFEAWRVLFARGGDVHLLWRLVE